MLTGAKNQFKVFLLSIKYNIEREMTNKVTFLTNIIFMILNNAAFIIEWIIFFSLKNNIGGYVLKDVLLLWGLSATTYGICFLFFGGCQELPRLIMDGKLDSFIVQPKNVLISVLSSKSKITAIGDIIYGFILLFIYGISFKNLLLFILFTVTGGIIITAVAVIYGSLAFYFTKSDTIQNNVMNIFINFSTYPDSIFKSSIKVLFYTIIPLGFAVYTPLHLMKSFNLFNFIVLLLFTALITTIAFLIFNRGLKKYSSTNLMSARI